MFDHEAHSRRLERQVDKLVAAAHSHRLERKVDKLVAAVQDVVDVLNKLSADVATLVSSSSGSVTPAQLDAVVSQAQAIDDSVVAATPAPPAPPA